MKVSKAKASLNEYQSIQFIAGFGFKDSHAGKAIGMFGDHDTPRTVQDGIVFFACLDKTVQSIADFRANLLRDVPATKVEQFLRDVAEYRMAMDVCEIPS